MKSSLTFSAIGAFSLAALALAPYAGAQDGGFAGPDNKQVVTIAEALELSDDTDVKIQGFVTRSLGDEKYEFTDDSGMIVVEIDEDEWEGLEVTPDLRVEILGEIEDERQGNELDADSIRLVN